MLFNIGGKFKEASEKYSKCLNLSKDPSKIITYYSNRALTYMKQEMYGFALNDANEALKIQPNCIKALYRRASAYCALNKWNEAIDDLREALKISPNNIDISEKYKWAIKEKKYHKFGNTLCFSTAVDRIIPENIVVEPSYQGPVLYHHSDITKKWVLDLISYFKNEKLLHKRFVIKMVKLVTEYYKAQSTLMEITIPDKISITICGDVHGQFYDLCELFAKNGYPSHSNPYLFNGDFVDRGSFSVEVILTLIAWNLLYPGSFFLNRGNHESIKVNMLYGFYGEVNTKYDLETYTVFQELFFALPLCYLINAKIFVVHGGLPNDSDVTLEDIKKIKRFREPPEQGVMADLLWSDFVNDDGLYLSGRGVCCAAGPDISAQFADNNKIQLIVRSHEVKDFGYEIQRGGRVVTVFSAPNYCDQSGNLGAYIKFTAPDMKPEYFQFSAVVTFVINIAAPK